MVEKTKEQKLLVAVVITAELLLGIHPFADRTTWFLENAPVFIGLPVLIALKDRFRFTNFVLRLMTLHALVLMVGGYYTYAEVPLGFWMKEAFHFSRNHYDRIGHFFQGFVPALMAREYLLRRSPLKRGFLLNYIVVSICLAISAFYELIEWWSAVALGSGAEAFLGTQGDPWDTQEDMFMALIGAIIAVTFFKRIQDRAITEASVT